jgi:hypothetical protein
MYPDQERLIFSYSFAKVGGINCLFISPEGGGRMFSESAVSTYNSDSQPGVRVPPGVRTRTFSGTRKKLNNGGKKAHTSTL